MRTRLNLLLAVSLLAAGLVAANAQPAFAAAAPRGAAASDAFFPSGDGTILHAEVVLPTSGCKDIVNADGTTGCPVIVSMGPYFGSGVQKGPGGTAPAGLGYGDITGDAVMSDRFFDFFAYNFDTDRDGKGDTNIFEMGYAVVQVDSRGYGSSGGCNDYGGYGEQMDMAAAVTWAGTRPWSNGQVGTWGKSYDAWTQVMGLAENPPHLEAAVIQAPISDGYGIAYVNGVHHSYNWYATTDLYALYDYTPNSIFEDPNGHINSATGNVGYNPNNNGVGTPACWAQQNAEVLNPDRDWYYWQERELSPRASRNDDVAVFFTHGFTDVNTKPDQAFPVYDGLTKHNGDQTRAWFGQWNHVRGSDYRGCTGTGGAARCANDNPHDDWVLGRAGWNEEALDWLNHYLRGEDFAYQVNAQNLVEAQDQLGLWRTEAKYPSTDVVYRDFPIAKGTYADNNSTNGYWTVSQPVAPGEEFRITGESTFELDVSITVPNAQFVGALYDIAANGTADEISRSMYRIEQSGKITFKSQPADWLIQAGHRLGFEVKSAHSEAFPYPTGQTVTVNSGRVRMPVPQFEREVNLGGVPTSARSLMRDSYTSGGTQIALDFSGWTRPYTGADAAAGIPNPQGKLNPSRPFE
jgi:putative CocE/NonD family hydrolase